MLQNQICTNPLASLQVQRKQHGTLEKNVDFCVFCLASLRVVRSLHDRSYFAGAKCNSGNHVDAKVPDVRTVGKAMQP